MERRKVKEKLVGRGRGGGGVTGHNVSLDRAGERPRCDDRGDK